MHEYTNEMERQLLTKGYVEASAAEIQEIKKAQEDAHNAEVSRAQAEIARLQALKSDRTRERQSAAACPICSTEMGFYEETEKIHTRVCTHCGFLANFKK